MAIVGAAEEPIGLVAIVVGKIDSEPFAGPEILAVDGVTDNVVPPVESPGLGAFLIHGDILIGENAGDGADYGVERDLATAADVFDFEIRRP